MDCQHNYVDTVSGHADAMAIFGERVRQWRLRAKLSQKQLAAACGFSQPALSAIESGETKPATLRAASLIRMARVLQVSAEELYTGRPPVIDTKTGKTQDAVLQMLVRMSPHTIDAWLENGATLLRHQLPVRLAEDAGMLHSTTSGCTTEAELLAVHGREETDRILAEEVARDDARKAAKPSGAKKRQGKQPSSNGAT